MKKNGDVLMEILEEAANVSEVPYQANRRAVKALDVDRDFGIGVKELAVVSNGVGPTIAKLEELKNAAKNVARKYAAVL